MSDILNCPSCGGANQLPENKSSMFCAYCGTGIEGGAEKTAVPDPSDNPQIAHFLELAENAEDSKDYREAIKYFNKALEFNPKLSEAWFGKASCSGASSTLKNINIAQVVANYKKAVDYSDDRKKEELKKRVLIAINNFANSLYTISFNHTVEFATVNGTYQEHINRVLEIIEALEYAHTIDPSNATIKRSLVDMAKGAKKAIWYNDHNKRLKVLRMNRSVKRQMEGIINKYSGVASDKPGAVEEIEKEIASQKTRNKWGYSIFIIFGVVLVVVGVTTGEVEGFLQLALFFGLGGPLIIYLTSFFVIKGLENRKSKVVKS